jgi:hypothetical protein
VFILVSTEGFMTCPEIDNPASREIRSVIRFLHAKITSAAEIHFELWAVYGQNVMSEGTVRKLCTVFKDGRINVHNEERSGRPSVVGDDFVQRETRRFTMSDGSCEFPQISHSVLYEIITARLGCHKFCAGWVPKMLTDAHVLERYHKDGDEFVNHIVRVIGDETWVALVNVETKEQSKHRMHTHSPNKPKKFKQTLSARKLMDCNGFLGQKRNADGGIHARRDHNNVTSVFRNTQKKKKNCVGPAIQIKSRGMLISGVVFLHDNASPHTAARTRALLEHFNWELLDHTPYGSDLTPSDYHLLIYLNNWLRSQRFNNNKGMMEGGKPWLSSQAADFFDTSIQKLIP